MTETPRIFPSPPGCPHQLKGHPLGVERIFTYTPKGIRTPVASVKGMCPRPLDDGGI